MPTSLQMPRRLSRPFLDEWRDRLDVGDETAQTFEVLADVKAFGMRGNDDHGAWLRPSRPAGESVGWFGRVRFFNTVDERPL